MAPGAIFSVAVFDLETSNLNADFGIVLCAVIMDVNTKEMKILRWDEMPEFKKDRSSDKQLCQAIKNELESYDVIVGYNSVKFDIPFLNTRLLKNKIGILSGIKHIDLLYSVKYNLKLSRNTLEVLTDFLETKMRKNKVDGSYWTKALVMAGTKKGKKAMDYIVEHCRLDVEVLAEAFGEIKDTIKVIKVR
jgi:uncharacterized protein YprB with RNaseH-like and TPR domain